MDTAFFVEQIQAGHCLSYLLVSENQAVLIDPHITKVQVYRDYLTKKGLDLKAVVDTHTHADHLSAAAIVAGEYDCPIVMSAKAVSSLDIDRVGEGDSVTFGRARLDVTPGPGHTDDSIVLLGDGHLFTGDVLLIGSVGRTDFQNGSPEDMFDTLAKLKALPETTTVYPAHDYKGHSHSTIGQEKAGNPFMLEEDRETFCAKARAKVLAKPFNMDAIVQTNREGLAREIEYISAGEARQRLDSADEAWRIIDVRQPQEYRAARIERSRNIALDTLAGRLDEVMDSDVRFILSCQSGARASLAASILMAAGHGQVSVMQGGLKAWEQDGGPVIREKVPVSLERQVRAIAGSLVLLGTLLGVLVNLWFLCIAIFVGSGLLFAGLTDSCMMGMLLMKLPYNRKAIQANIPDGGSCSLDDGGCAM